MHSSLRATLLAICLAVAAANAAAGRIDPGLDEKLRNAAPGEQFAVIVEMKEQAPPAAVLAGMPKASRKARLKALVSGLRERAQRGQSALKAELAQQHALGNVRRMRAFWIFNGFALTADAALIRRLAAREDVREVRIDALIAPPPVPASAEPASTQVEWNIAQIRAPEVWAHDPPYNGSEVVVGSFDTGVDFSHPDLADRYRGDHAISWFDPYGEHPSPFDYHGHGTHTTGTAVGGNSSATAIGVAPGAKWIAAKAWADDGTGLASAFHQIFEWFLAPGGDPDNAPDVVINSWSLNLPGCITEFAPDIQAWRAAGIFPAFAAGNSGPGTGSVRSPGAYPEAFAVGATDIFDEIASFSSRGPSPCSGVTKPDISAPGAGVRSSLPGNGYGTLSGTSMATPHVAGAVAVLRSINSALTIDELSDLLKLGATDVANPGADNDSGAGRMDLFVSAEIAIRGLNTPLVKIVATQPTATEAGPTAGTLTVTRTGSTDAELQVRLEVAGTATAGSDYVALPSSVAIPAGAASVALSVLAIDDALQEPNETVVVTIAPDPAYIPLGSRVAAVIIVSDELFPDLAASALSAPAIAGAGQSITLTETTRNQGGGAAAASTTRYFLSSNAAFNAGDAELASRAVPALVPGAASSASVPVTIPAGTAPATWYLIAVADADGTVLETAETNNTVSRSIQIGPDLTVSALSAPAVSGAGESLVLSATTANQGGGPADASQTRYFLSANTVLDAADVQLGSRDVAALAPSATSVDAATLVVPATTATGSWYIIAAADATNLVPETSETNNTRNRSIRIGPDLTVSLAAPPNAGAGLSVSLTDTTENSGGGAAGASVTGFYLSSNASWDAADLPLGTRDVSALAAATSSSGTITTTLPGDLASGNWYLLARADTDSTVTETLESNNVVVRGIKVGPDLAVTAFTAPATAGPGDSITVSESTTNTGGGVAAASVTRYFLSATSTLDAAAVPLGSHGVAALQPGTASPASTTISIPPGTAAGTWYLVAKADADATVSEVLETNNVASRSIKVGADLIVSTMSTPSDAGAGQSVTIADTTKNGGGGTADPSITRLYLSADITLDAADVLIGTRSVAALAAGASSSASTPVTIPPGTATGTWQVLAVADATDAVTETVETNNVYRRAIDIGPDLTVSALTMPATAGAGQTLSISDTTRNQGGGAVGASSTAYFLSSDSTLDSRDVQLASRTVPALAAGASSTASTALTIPAGTATGSWYILAAADTAGLLAETSESNNLASRSLKVGSDLSVSALTVPSVTGAGRTLTVNDTTKNGGGSPVDASQTYFFLSPDSTLQASDTQLASRDVPALTAGASNGGSVQLTIPADTSAGRWYLFAVADGPGSIEESVETNNVASRPFTVGPDLSISALTIPTSAGAGQRVTVNVTARNLGGDDALPSVTQLFLSANNTLEEGDIALGERAVLALAPGASSTASVEVLIPAGTAAGRWYLLAKTDALNGITEAVETNNVTARSIDILAP